MQANFSALYHGCSLKTISDFYNKVYKNYIADQSDNTLAHQKAPAGNCRQGLWLIQFIQLRKLTFAFTLRL